MQDHPKKEGENHYSDHQRASRAAHHRPYDEPLDVATSAEDLETDAILANLSGLWAEAEGSYHEGPKNLYELLQRTKDHPTSPDQILF